MMKRKIVWPVILFFLACVFLVLACGLKFLGKHQAEKISRLEKAIGELKEETVPIRFMILSHDDGSLRFRLRFYNLAGEEMGMQEMSLPGRQLYLDFFALPMDKSWLALPYRVFTESIAPAEGVLLSRWTIPGLIPLNYSGGPFDSQALEELGKTYLELLAGGEVRGSFGNAVHDIAELGNFRLEQVYRVVVRKKGGIEILEDE